MIAVPANDLARIAALESLSAPRFTPQDLILAEIPYALPLVRATWPAMDDAAWQDFVAGFCADATLCPAITALSDPAGGLCGLFASRIEAKPGKRVLAVPLFTVVDIGNSLEPVRALVAAVEAKAAKCDCPTIDIQLGKRQARLRERLFRLSQGGRAGNCADGIAPQNFVLH